MNGNPFTPNIADLVGKYQDRWQFCLDRNTHTYYWLGGSAQQDLRGSQDGSGHFQENPLKGLNYDTEVHHTRRDDYPDACFFKARSSAKPLYCPHHGRPVLGPESLQSPAMSGPGWPGRPGRPELSRDLLQ